MKQIKVLLIEDHFLARMALRSVFEGHPHISIFAEASDGGTRHRNSFVCTSRMSWCSTFGFLASADLKSCGNWPANEHPARVVILSNYQGSEDIYRAVRSGAMAYLTKDASGEELLNAIQKRKTATCATSRAWRSTALPNAPPSLELTPRESEVLVCITKGQSNREIAEYLKNRREDGPDPRLVGPCKKMGARDRTQAHHLRAANAVLVHLDN